MKVKVNNNNRFFAATQQPAVFKATHFFPKEYGPTV